jgi:hypothetical protein
MVPRELVAGLTLTKDQALVSGLKLNGKKSYGSLWTGPEYCEGHRARVTLLLTLMYSKVDPARTKVEDARHGLGPRRHMHFHTHTPDQSVYIYCKCNMIRIGGKEDTQRGTPHRYFCRVLNFARI